MTRIEVDDEAPEVAGEVRLMTDEPVEIDADEPTTPLVQLMRILDERPWLAPAALLSFLALVLLLRRRTD